MKRIVFYILLSISTITIVFASDARDRGSWKKPLHSKAVYFEKNMAERHNIDGTCPSSVGILPPKHYAGEGSQKGAWSSFIQTGELPPGWIYDHGTSGMSNIAHTSSWTGCYLTAQAFRVAFTKSLKAYARASEVIQGIRNLTLVSGVPGYLSRGYVYGHGASYEERVVQGIGTRTRDLWAQGAGELKHVRYRQGPSHHNYDHVLRGLGIYYFIAANDEQKIMIKNIVRDISNYIHLKNDMVVKHVDGQRISTVLIGGWGGMGGDIRPSGGSLMATTGLKIAAEILGDKKLHEKYAFWVEKLGYRKAANSKVSIMGRERANYDDTDHLLGDLYLLNIIEKDPKLRAFYHKCVEDSWKVHKDDKIAWYNFVYSSLLEKDCDIDGAIWNLQTHPTCRVFQPQMNSIRKDIEIIEVNGKKQSKYPLPMYERPFDNEYEYKKSLYELDGWLSSTITHLEISKQDHYVQYAVDNSGKVYRSYSDGEIWHQLNIDPCRTVMCHDQYLYLIFAAGDQGVFISFDGGDSWKKVFDQPVNELTLDPDNPHIIYAVGPKGIYKCVDSGEREMGSTWLDLSGYLPAHSQCAMAVDPRGEKATLYLLASDGFYTKQESETEWNVFPRVTRKRGFSSYEGVGGTPLWVRVDPHVRGRIIRAVSGSYRNNNYTLITVSPDSGRNWFLLDDMTKNTTKMSFRVIRDVISKGFKSQLYISHTQPGFWYALKENKVQVSKDSGATWETLDNAGLDIPQIRSLLLPRNTTEIYVGTPAGVYVSYDEAKTWQGTSLVIHYSLTFSSQGALREEIGGIAYLTAYWMGRYHGFISTKDAERTFKE
jgi:hypothetical protein